MPWASHTQRALGAEYRGLEGQSRGLTMQFQRRCGRLARALLVQGPKRFSFPHQLRRCAPDRPRAKRAARVAPPLAWLGLFLCQRRASSVAAPPLLRQGAGRPAKW